MARIDNLLNSPEDRAARHIAKQRAVLRFLRQHLWSTQDILQHAMNLESRQAAHKALQILEAESLIRRHTFEALGGKVTLWGITAHGQAMSFEIGEEQPISAYFEPSRISEQNIRHQLDLQRLRLTAEAAGWHSWTDGDRIGGIPRKGKRPDAIAIDPQGQTTAIECERIIKTEKRYQQVLVSYLMAIKSETVSRVVWVSPTENIATRLRAVITGINTVVVAGQKVTIDPTRHHQKLNFTSYDRWPDA